MRVLLVLAGLLGLTGRSAAAADSAKAELLSSSADVRKLCAALRPDGDPRVRPTEEVARGRQRAEAAARRRELLLSSYVTDVPASGWLLREYDDETRRLEPELSRSLRLGDGVDLSPLLGEDDDFGWPLSPEQAEHLAKERAKGALSLRVAYRLAQSELSPDPCVRVSGGRVLRLRIEPSGVAAVGPDGKVRVAMGSLQLEVGPRPADAPEVRLGRLALPPGRSLEAWTAAAQGLHAALRECYEQGLRGNAMLRGSLVMGLSVTSDGKVERVRTEIDALGDEAVAACVHTKLRGAAGFPHRATNLSLPVFFSARE